MTDSVPVDIWHLIAAEVLPNPYHYTKWSHVCRNSRAAFTTDALWASFTPVPVESHYAQNFHDRMEAFSESQRQKHRNIWTEIEKLQEIDLDEGEYEMESIHALLLRAQYFSEDVLSNPDLWLSGMLWGHNMCWTWLPDSILLDREAHSRFVAGQGVMNRHFMLTAARLYGPLIRYASNEYLDDEEIVLAAAEYHLTANCDKIGTSRLHKWKHIPQFEFVSERLKKKKHITLAFVSRWPLLAQHIPEELRGDSDLQPYIHQYESLMRD